jgi:hypothetical protein
MGERSSTPYLRLFEIRVLHHYWLDEGDQEFDHLQQDTTGAAHLLAYDARTFLAVTPTAATARTLKNLGCIYRDTPLGCAVAVHGEAILPTDAQLDFAVALRGADVLGYTALTLQPRRIYSLFYEPEHRTRRYKENVVVLSNLTGTARGTGQDKALYLSREYAVAAGDERVESLVNDGGELKQLTSDEPNSTRSVLGAAASAPVYIHQGDVPAITPPPALDGVPARGIELTGDIPDDVFALIHLSAVRQDDPAFSFVDAEGHVRTPCPVYQVRLKNRSTVWRRLKQKTGELIGESDKPLPLTWFGNAGAGIGKGRKPPRGLVEAEMNGDRVVRLISKIYE